MRSASQVVMAIAARLIMQLISPDASLPLEVVIS